MLLFVAFTGQTFRNSIIVLDYYAHTGKYLRNCVYGERTVTMHCYGKCSMVKKIKEEQGRENQIPIPKTDNRDEVLYMESFACSLPAAIPAPTELNLLPPTKATRDIHTDHFHPPPTA